MLLILLQGDEEDLSLCVCGCIIHRRRGLEGKSHCRCRICTVSARAPINICILDSL